MSGRDCEDRLKVEVDGENTLPIFKTLTDIMLKNENINKVLVEIESDGPLKLDKYTEDMYKTGPENPLEGGLIDFEDDSECFILAQCMVDAGRGWMNTGEIKRELVPQIDIDEDRLSQILWDLCERGVLDKRPYELDKRMKEYRVTGLGVRSVKAADE